MAKILARFEILKDFSCEELQSDYCEGLTYSLRKGNDKLATLLPEWIAAGKAKLIDDTVPLASVQGG